MNLENKILTINDNDYLIIEQVDYENKKYIYIINKNEELDSMFVEINLNDEIKLKEINNELFENKIYPLFLEKFKNYK